MHGVFSKDAIDVWAVGDAGVVYRSLDGGDTYDDSFLGDDRLYDVAHEGLVVLVVGDSGKVWRSTDNGGTWGVAVPAGDIQLRAVQFVDATTAFICGESGTILKSVDAGASWSAQTSGTSSNLYGMTWSGPANGWVVGEGGTVRRTTTGGGLWSGVTTGATADLLDAGVDGSRVWVVGIRGQALKSTDGGTNWDPVNLRLDARSDVFNVHLSGGSDVVLAGGGGFVRTSDDDGATWDWSEHNLQAYVSDFHVVGTDWYLATSQDEAVLHTTDAGATWDFPSGTSISRSWVLKQPPGCTNCVRGNTFSINWQNPNTIYAMMAGQVYRSRDLGETWQTQGNDQGSTKTNSFIVSPKDSNDFIAAVYSGSPMAEDRIVSSVNGGTSWQNELTQMFGEYGLPVEMDPDHPDTLFFGPDNDVLKRSTNFGQNWSDYSDSTFRSPCDIVVVPESDSAVILVGDGITSTDLGEIWRATGGDTDFNLVHEGGVNASEVPTISSSRLRNNVLIATAWSQPAPQLSSDFGLTWAPPAALASLNSSWGTDIAKDDPNCLIVGQYGSARQTYLSFDGGTSYSTLLNTGNNYSYYMRDRATIFQMQSTGIYKMNIDYGYTPGVGAQSLTLSVPNGGEVYTGGTVEPITWNADNVALAIIEYRTAPSEPWVEIAQVPGYLGTYDWTVPFTPTNKGRVRIRDGWDGNPSDMSAGDFDIVSPAIAVSPDSLDFGDVEALMTSTLVLTIDNPGDAQLDVTDVTLQSGDFTIGRTAFSIAGGNNDTLGVTFRPTAVTGYVDTLEIVHNAGDPVRIPLKGNGTDQPALTLTAPIGGEEWFYGTAQLITWSYAVVESITIEYQRTTTSPWNLLSGSFPADSNQFTWIMPDSVTDGARVRIREIGGPLESVSPSPFTILVPWLTIYPTIGNAGLATVGGSASAKFSLINAGNGTIDVSSISSDDADFTVDQSSLTIAPYGKDSIFVTFSPLAVGPDTTTITFVTNGSRSPHLLTVVGEGTETVSVPGDVPLAFALGQNRPNPFTGMTRIEYALPQRADVRLDVFDLQGKRVATLVRGEQEPGRYSVEFGSGAQTVGGRLGAVRSGVYFYRLQAGPHFATRKMLLLR